MRSLILTSLIKNIADHLAPDLIKKPAVGYEFAAQLLIISGTTRPADFRSRGVRSIVWGYFSDPGIIRQTHRHRLNRGGDRQANSTLHIIAIGRLRTDPRTQDYVAKKLPEGHSKWKPSGA